MKNKQDKFPKKIRSKAIKADLVIAISVNVILLISFSRIQNLNISWLTNTAVITISLFELSFAAQILGNLILLMRSPHLLQQIIKIIINMISFLPIYALYILYPFNFSQINAPSWTDMMVKLFIILSMIVLVITTVVEIIRIFQHQNESLLDSGAGK